MVAIGRSLGNYSEICNRALIGERRDKGLWNDNEMVEIVD